MYQSGSDAIRHCIYEVPLIGKSQKDIAKSITIGCHGDTISDLIDQIDELDTEENNQEGNNDEP